MTASIREIIGSIFLDVFSKQVEGVPVPKLSDDLILLQSGLDSMGFAVLVVELEEKLGFDPFTISDEPFYPSTFGDFVVFYEKHQPK